MSDSESMVSSISEYASSLNDLSDIEATESTDPHYPERDRLSLYEYVSTINVEATLARDFQRHSLYNHGVGKNLRLDSEDAAERMSYDRRVP